VKADLIHPRLHVLTKPESPCPILATPESLTLRRAGHGIVWKPVEGHENTWWVRHLEDDSVAPYLFYELEEDLNPPEEPRFSPW